MMSNGPIGDLDWLNIESEESIRPRKRQNIITISRTFLSLVRSNRRHSSSPRRYGKSVHRGGRESQWLCSNRLPEQSRFTRTSEVSPEITQLQTRWDTDWLVFFVHQFSAGRTAPSGFSAGLAVEPTIVLAIIRREWQWSGRGRGGGYSRDHHLGKQSEANETLGGREWKLIDSAQVRTKSLTSMGLEFLFLDYARWEEPGKNLQAWFAFCNRYDALCLSCLSLSLPLVVVVLLLLFQAWSGWFLFFSSLSLSLLLWFHFTCVRAYVCTKQSSPLAHHHRRYSSCGMFDTIKRKGTHTRTRTREHALRKLNYSNTNISFLGLVSKIGREKKRMSIYN